MRLDKPEKRALLMLIAAFGVVTAVAMLILSSTARAQSVPPTRLGINLPQPSFWMDARSFNNLALYAVMIVKGPSRPAGRLDLAEMGPGGWPSKLSPGATALLPLLVPMDAKSGDVFRCTWQGDAQAWAGGGVRMADSAPGAFEFVLTGDGRNITRMNGAKPTSIYVTFANVVGTVSDFDCREKNRPRDQVFDPAFIRSLAPYRVVRFMDWMNANAAPKADFAREIGPSRPRHVDNAVTLTDMLTLAREAKVDPWFTMPYLGSDDYIRRFAQMAHDTLPADRIVYVELGNEAWHDGFFTGKMSMVDGVKAKLGRYPYEGQLMQYSLRAKHMLDIWAQVYADRPKSLVRVYTGNVRDASSLEIIGQNGVAQSFDALAISPYFGGKVYPANPSQPKPANIDEAFVQISGEVDTTLTWIRKCKEVANRFNKRLIGYEAGQHILIPYDVPLLEKIQHDPRMGDAYTKLLDGWAREFGDTIVMFNQVGGAGAAGSFGLVDHDGQPPQYAPKLKAVLAFAAKHPPGNK